MTRSEFEHIAHSLRPLVLQVALDFFGSRDEAEDATQEAMLQLWRFCERIDIQRNIEALAVRVAKNCCVNLYRKQQKGMQSMSLSEKANAVWNTPSSAPSPHEELEAQDAQAVLAEVIARLKPRERELFEMRRLYGLSIDEIIAQTGLQRASVRTMISIARKKVFTELKQRLKQ